MVDANKGPHSEMQITFDFEKALNNTGGDRSLMELLGRILIEDVPILANELQSASQLRDSAHAKHFVHSLRGLCATFSAEPAVGMAMDIETEISGGCDIQKLASKIESLLACLDATVMEMEKSLSGSKIKP